METLMLTLLMVGVLMVILQTKGEAPVPVAPAAPVAGNGPEYVRTVSVTVAHPAELADAIERVRRDSTRNMFAPNYVVGEPHISPDGLTAHISLFR